MGVVRKKVAVQELETGMFVSDLDRPWHETPFPIQGFVIRSADELTQLTRYCRHVFVDVAEAKARQADTGTTRVRRPGVAGKVLKLPAVQIRNPRKYHTDKSLKRAIREAVHLLDDVSEALDHVMETVRGGKLPQFEKVESIARQMTQSIVHNPDALLWLTRVQHRDQYSYQHSLNTAIWALVLGRHLGLEEDVLEHLATGALLCHVGKARLPEELLVDEDDLSKEDFARYASYVTYGVKMLEQAGMSRSVINIVRSHRERHNGSGFPRRVNGEEIPLLAKLVGLVDHYETLIEPRPGSEPLTPAQAVSRLYEDRNVRFQEDLVERFIQAVGIYPTGTIVELSNHYTGVVLSHRPDRRLWPTVMVVADQNREPLKGGRVIDLAEYNDGKVGDEALTVSGCLPFGIEGIDPARYDVGGGEAPAQASRWSLKRLIGRKAV